MVKKNFKNKNKKFMQAFGRTRGEHRNPNPPNSNAIRMDSNKFLLPTRPSPYLSHPSTLCTRRALQFWPFPVGDILLSPLFSLTRVQEAAVRERPCEHAAALP